MTAKLKTLSALAGIAILGAQASTTLAATETERQYIPASSCQIMEDYELTEDHHRGISVRRAQTGIENTSYDTLGTSTIMCPITMKMWKSNKNLSVYAYTTQGPNTMLECNLIGTHGTTGNSKTLTYMSTRKSSWDNYYYGSARVTGVNANDAYAVHCELPSNNDPLAIDQVRLNGIYVYESYNY